MDQQISDLLEFARLGDVENVIAAIVQIVAGLADRAQRAVLPAVTPDSATDFFGLKAPAFGVLLSASLIDCLQKGLEFGHCFDWAALYARNGPARSPPAKCLIWRQSGEAMTRPRPTLDFINETPDFKSAMNARIMEVPNHPVASRPP
ncbi:hypothetical protein OKW30_005515 [Paraburkholderia sp. Clong3]